MPRAWSLEQCLILLEQLCRPDAQLARFAEEAERSQQLLEYFTATGRGGRKLQLHAAAIIQHAALQQLAAAFSRGLQLLVAQLGDGYLEQLPVGCRQALVTVARLGSALIACSKAFSERHGSETAQQRVQPCNEIVSSGLLPAVAAAAPVLANLLWRLHRLAVRPVAPGAAAGLSHNPQAGAVLMLLSSTVLGAWCNLSRWWALKGPRQEPPALMLTPQHPLSPTLIPAAQLTAAYACCVDAGAGSNLCTFAVTAHTAVSAVAALTYQMVCIRQHSSPLAAAVVLLESPDIQHVVLLKMALVAAELHDLQQGMSAAIPAAAVAAMASSPTQNSSSSCRHSSRSGKGCKGQPSKQTKLAVAAHHLQLLEALGARQLLRLLATGQFWPVVRDAGHPAPHRVTVTPPLAALEDVMAHLFQLQQQPDTPPLVFSRATNMAPGSSSTSVPAAHRWAPFSLYMPLQLTLLEVSLLMPDVGCFARCMTLMAEAYRLFTVLPLWRAAGQHRPAFVPWSVSSSQLEAAGDAAGVVAGIARPVLKQLAPAALYAVQQPELLGESTNVAQALVERLHLGFGQVLLLTSMYEQDEMVAAIQQQPLAAVTMLDAGLRRFCTLMGSSVVLEEGDPMLVRFFASRITHLLKPCTEQLAVAAAPQSKEQQQLANQLFSLCISCTKCLGAAAAAAVPSQDSSSGGGSSNSHCQDDDRLVLEHTAPEWSELLAATCDCGSLAVGLAGAAVAPAAAPAQPLAVSTAQRAVPAEPGQLGSGSGAASHSSNNGTFGVGKPATAGHQANCWLALLARVVMLQSKVLVILHPDPEQPFEAVRETTGAVLETAKEFVSCLTEHLLGSSLEAASSSTAAAHPAPSAGQQQQQAQRLLGLLAQVQTALLCPVGDSAEQHGPSNATDRATVFGQLAEELSTFGAVVCSELPVPLCCNNPGCLSLAGASELELVGGKGTVCKCKEARYCCKQCQVDHWKQHKAVCKRLQVVAATAAAKQ